MALLSPPHPRVRAAASHDLDAMATIICQAMPLDPQWDYRFPLRKQFPEDNYECTRRMLQSMLYEYGVYISVVTIPSPGCLKEEEEVPVGLAVWELMGYHSHSRRDKDNSEELETDETDPRRDANLEHMRAFTSALASAKKSYFEEKYHPDYVHLRILATHPNFQRRGAGTALCRWGMEFAREGNEPLTVFASPMGQKLYTSLGFESLGSVPVQVEGEEQRLAIEAMIRHPTPFLD